MRYVPALILDAVFVLVFAVIGRASHQEDPGGFLITAWPFLVALLAGHLIAAALPARPRRPWSLPWGVVVWVVTVTGGILLRLASGDTAQVAFVIVATLTLGVLLVGWRAVAALLRRRAGRSAEADAEADADADADADPDADPDVDVEATGDPGVAEAPWAPHEGSDEPHPRS
ncbi:DUF3054 domain-containing protein [Microbacterium sp. NPDC089695]|uniref:DUF3054 domain-containing protein n=1 Tax=Microbacterium sp. NPDC089695 TaxID=3364198 RepID=UPI00381FDA4C